jgi:hypothetical protein
MRGTACSLVMSLLSYKWLAHFVSCIVAAVVLRACGATRHVEGEGPGSSGLELTVGSTRQERNIRLMTNSHRSLVRAGSTVIPAHWQRVRASSSRRRRAAMMHR